MERSCWRVSRVDVDSTLNEHESWQAVFGKADQAFFPKTAVHVQLWSAGAARNLMKKGGGYFLIYAGWFGGWTMGINRSIPDATPESGWETKQIRKSLEKSIEFEPASKGSRGGQGVLELLWVAGRCAVAGVPPSRGWRGIGRPTQSSSTEQQS